MCFFAIPNYATKQYSQLYLANTFYNLNLDTVLKLF